MTIQPESNNSICLDDCQRLLLGRHSGKEPEWFSLEFGVYSTNNCFYLTFQETSSSVGGRIFSNASAVTTSGGDAGGGVRSGHIPGTGSTASAPSPSNAGSAYSGSNSSYSNRGRGANIPSGPRAGVPQPRPPPRAVDPSAMEVLGLLPPERPPPPATSGGSTGYLGRSNPGPTPPAHGPQATQQYNRPTQQQPSGSYGGQSSGVGSTSATDEWQLC